VKLFGTASKNTLCKVVGRREMDCKGREEGGRVWTVVGKEDESSDESICSCREEDSVECSRNPEKRNGEIVLPPEQ
jgi:hypothetical protein